MIAASLHHNRPWRMRAFANTMEVAAALHEKHGNLARLQQAIALAEAYRYAQAEPRDRVGVRIALSDARFFARIKRREARDVSA